MYPNKAIRQMITQTSPTGLAIDPIPSSLPQWPPTPHRPPLHRSGVRRLPSTHTFRPTRSTGPPHSDDVSQFFPWTLRPRSVVQSALIQAALCWSAQPKAGMPGGGAPAGRRHNLTNRLHGLCFGRDRQPCSCLTRVPLPGFRMHKKTMAVILCMHKLTMLATARWLPCGRPPPSTSYVKRSV